MGPSTPQFHERLWLSPSLPPSPFASLCFSLYETRSLQREPVVRGHEVDRRVRAAAVGLVEVAAAGQARGELAERAGLAAPEVADGVAVLAVPLRPQRREVADLVAAGPDVPRLGDQLGLADHRVLLDQVEEHRQPVDVVELAGEGGREVEPEAVDVHLGDPVPQRVHDQLKGVRVAHVQRVAGARVVHVVPLVVFDEAVVGGVVDAAHRQRGAHVVALGRVVVDDVEDHLDARVVQVADHRLELLHLAARPAVRLRVGVVGGQERDGVVAPVVREALLLQVVVGDELVHRHELHRGDAQVLQVLDHHRVRQARVGAAQLLGDAGVLDGEALDVRLVDHGLVVGDARVAVAAPVEERVDDHGLRHERRRVGVAALVRAAERVAEHRLVPLAPGRRGPWRRGRSAACSGCTAGPRRGRTDRGSGSRSAGRARRWAGSRATRSRRPRGARRGSPYRLRRRDTAPRGPRSRRRSRSSSRRRRSSRPRGRHFPATAAWGPRSPALAGSSSLMGKDAPRWRCPGWIGCWGPGARVRSTWVGSTPVLGVANATGHHRQCRKAHVP